MLLRHAVPSLIETFYWGVLLLEEAAREQEAREAQEKSENADADADADADAS
jgi:hypothetical protein